MNTFSNHIATRPVQTVFKLACIAAILAGCGGGGDSGTTSTTSFASGPIQGFGSIIVNGVRFDDSSAKVSSEDDDNGESRDRSELKLGMVVEVQGGGTTSDDSGRHGKANEIHFGSEIVGPVEAGSKTSSATGGSFKILGQTVVVSDSTVFDNSLPNRLGSIADNAILEVHGLIDPSTKEYKATRIEPKANATLFKIRGEVSELNKNGDKTFMIGTELISFATASSVPSTLKDGDVVRVKLQTTKVSGQPWVATKVKSGVRKVEDHDEAEVKGLVTDLSDDGKKFNIGPHAVDATAVANLVKLSNSSFVEVEGSIVGGILVARKVELEDNNKEGANEFEFHRKITSVEGKVISLGETKISWDDKTQFLKGATATDLKAQACVEIKAVGTATTMLRAVRIKLDNSCTQ